MRTIHTNVTFSEVEYAGCVSAKFNSKRNLLKTLEMRLNMLKREISKLEDECKCVAQLEDMSNGRKVYCCVYCGRSYIVEL